MSATLLKESRVNELMKSRAGWHGHKQTKLGWYVALARA